MSNPADLITLSERPRTADWTMRAALVRYAQPEPARASAVLELVRRVDGALHPHTRHLEGGGEPDDTARPVLEAAAVLDQMGDVLVDWAIEPAGPRPDPEVDRLARVVFDALADADVPRETRPPRRS